jgi:hypothetical protein
MRWSCCCCSGTCRVHRVVAQQAAEEALVHHDDGGVAAHAAAPAAAWRYNAAAAAAAGGYDHSAGHAIAGALRVYLADMHPGAPLVFAPHYRDHLQPPVTTLNATPLSRERTPAPGRSSAQARRTAARRCRQPAETAPTRPAARWWRPGGAAWRTRD